MKIKILRGHCLGKGVDVYPGDTVDLPEWLCRLKIQEGKAKLLPAEPPPVEPPPAEAVAADPEPVHADPQPRKTRKRRER